MDQTLSGITGVPRPERHFKRRDQRIGQESSTGRLGGFIGRVRRMLRLEGNEAHLGS
jgi:hypothetical protein